ncbi:MAG: hypothetical protein ACYTFT_14380 [Planctomycetota bacterium]|jgi:hypothetical protein
MVFWRTVGTEPCGAGGSRERSWSHALGFSFPTLPPQGRQQYPDFYEQIGRWSGPPKNAVFECIRFPDFRDKGRGPPTLGKGDQRQYGEFEGKADSGSVTLRVGPKRPVLEGTDDAEPRDKGGVGIATWGGVCVYRTVRVTGRLDEEWLRKELER